MSIEKAFAIRANPHEIYAAIQSDLAAAGEHEGSTYEVLHSDPGRSIRLRVTIGGMPCHLRYEIIPRDEHCEVVASLDPYGWRYTAFRIMTLGLSNGGFEATLVQSLANLKAAVEAGTAGGDDDAPFPDEGARLVTAPDE